MHVDSIPAREIIRIQRFIIGGTIEGTDFHHLPALLQGLLQLRLPEHGLCDRLGHTGVGEAHPTLQQGRHRFGLAKRFARVLNQGKDGVLNFFLGDRCLPAAQRMKSAAPGPVSVCGREHPKGVACGRIIFDRRPVAVVASVS